MRKRHSAKTVLLAISTCCFLLFSFSTAYAAGTVLKLQLWQGPTHTWTKEIKKLAPYMEKFSGGKLKVKIYDSSVLAKNSEFLEACTKGIIDIGDWYPMSNSKTLPFVNIMGGLPLVYSNATGANKAWSDPNMLKLLEKALAENGYKKVGVGPTWNAGFFHLGFKNKEVKVPGDLKGLKLLVRGDTTEKYLEQFGVSTVSTITSSEVYDALSRGIIDGNWGVHSNWVDWKWMEPNQYFLNVPLNGIQMCWVWNKTKMDKLPDELRQIANGWLQMVTLRLALINYEMQDTYFDMMRTNMEFYTPTKEEMTLWQAPKGDIVKEYIKVAGDLGAKAIEIVKKYNE